MFDMIRQAQALKEKMSQFQEELEKQTFTGEALGGAVTVVVNGKHAVQKITLKPEALKDGGKLEAALQEALNAAGTQVNARLKEQVSKMTGGLGLPGLF
ncbi:MAG TPA: YbaB/EbfC family nucleoid-associated protein [bacterium]|nr:YbaB/EbfC family nucleoid-associated protein [bacterium]